MGKKTDNKSAFLGMPVGTAQSRLKKMILFHLLKKYNENYCFRCDGEIESIEELSIEHKKPWLYESVDLFWNIDNIAFSHLNCNSGATRNLYPSKLIHNNTVGYNYHKCRCDECKNDHKETARKYRKKLKNMAP